MKKKLLVTTLIVSMTALGLAACGNSKQDSAPTKAPVEETQEEAPAEEEKVEEATDMSFYSELPDMFYFSSGAGAWGTEIVINDDGSFTGSFHDSDMGDSGPAYPNGTLYYCEFEGQFSAPEKIDDYTYRAHLDEITALTKTDATEVIDGVRYKYSDPYGFDDCEDVEFYVPGTPLAQLSEEFTSWTLLGMGFGGDDCPLTELPFYGMYNINGQMGFSSEIDPAYEAQVEAAFDAMWGTADTDYEEESVEAAVVEAEAPAEATTDAGVVADSSYDGIYVGGLIGSNINNYSSDMDGIETVVIADRTFTIQGRTRHGATTEEVWSAPVSEYTTLSFPLDPTVTFYTQGGDNGATRVSQEEFMGIAELYNGLGLIIEVKNGCVVTATISS